MMQNPTSFLSQVDANKSPLAADVIAQMTAELTPENKDFYDVFKKSRLAQTSLAGQSVRIGGSMDPFRVVGAQPAHSVSAVAQPATAADLQRISIDSGQVINAYDSTRSNLSVTSDIAEPGAQLVNAVVQIANSTPSMGSVSDLMGALLGVTAWAVRDILHKPLAADWLDAISGATTMVVSGVLGDWLRFASAAFASTVAVLDIRLQATQANLSSRALTSYTLSQTGSATWSSVLLANAGPVAEMLMHAVEALGKAGEIVEAQQGSSTTEPHTSHPL